MGERVKVVHAVLVLAVVLFASVRGGAAAAGESERVPSLSPEAAPGAPGPSSRASAPRLRLVWIDVLGSAPFAFLNASREAAVILSGVGVDTSWTLGDASSVTTGDELKIVLMQGVANGARLPEHVMGGTGRGARSRTTWVYVSNVLWALGLQDRPRTSFTSGEEEDIARALGRVVAHEIVHIVAPDLPHSRHGLMASRIGRDHLVRGSLSLAPGEQRALRAGLEAFAPPTEPLPAVVALAAARR